MKVKHLYAAFCIVGAALPYSYFIPWLVQNGLNLHLFVEQLFANRIAAFFVTDVVVSAIVVFVFVVGEGKRLNMRGLLWPILAVLFVGVSLGLPLFLFLRELKIDEEQVTAAGA